MCKAVSTVENSLRGEAEYLLLLRWSQLAHVGALRDNLVSSMPHLDDVEAPLFERTALNSLYLLLREGVNGCCNLLVWPLALATIVTE